MKRQKDNWIRLTLDRNCLLKRIITGNMEEMMDVKDRQGRRRKQIIDNLE
jgi:hypothetical protein